MKSENNISINSLTAMFQYENIYQMTDDFVSESNDRRRPIQNNNNARNVRNTTKQIDKKLSLTNTNSSKKKHNANIQIPNSVKILSSAQNYDFSHEEYWTSEMKYEFCKDAWYDSVGRYAPTDGIYVPRASFESAYKKYQERKICSNIKDNVACTINNSKPIPQKLNITNISDDVRSLDEDL